MNDRNDGVPVWVVILPVFLALAMDAAGGGVRGFVAGMKVGGVFDFIDADFKEPQGIAVAVDYPEESVRIGEKLEVTLKVQNTSEQPPLLHSPDFDAEYFDGFSIEGSDPPFARQEANDGFRSAHFGLSIPAGGEQVVKLKLKAVKPGIWSGDLDVCINDELSFLTNDLETEVQAPDALPPDSEKKNDPQ